MTWGRALSAALSAVKGAASRAFGAKSQSVATNGHATPTTPSLSDNSARHSRLKQDCERLAHEIQTRRRQHRATCSLRRRLRNLRTEMLRIETERNT